MYFALWLSEFPTIVDAVERISTFFIIFFLMIIDCTLKIHAEINAKSRLKMMYHNFQTQTNAQYGDISTFFIYFPVQWS